MVPPFKIRIENSDFYMWFRNHLHSYRFALVFCNNELALYKGTCSIQLDVGMQSGLCSLLSEVPKLEPAGMGSRLSG